MGLVAARNRAVPAFGIATGEDRTSIFTRPIRLGGADTLAASQ
jgi:hypothetical protein